MRFRACFTNRCLWRLTICVEANCCHIPPDNSRATNCCLWRYSLAQNLTAFIFPVMILSKGKVASVCKVELAIDMDIHATVFHVGLHEMEGRISPFPAENHSFYPSSLRVRDHFLCQPYIADRALFRECISYFALNRGLWCFLAIILRFTETVSLSKILASVADFT